MTYSGRENPVARQLEYETENDAVTSPSEPVSQVAKEKKKENNNNNNLYNNLYNNNNNQ